ncbi:MAG: hypothetical protein HYX66_00315 [Ignavibacteria bacterium]|nr:hypothetical protein [Ignavibacteria bacterium]
MAIFDPRTIRIRQMMLDSVSLLYSSYVAFVFACIFFGALAYRQILDNLDVKRLKMGEDRDSFIDAGAGITVAVLWVFVIVVAVFAFYILKPSIVTYALPMILAAQTMQFSLRMLFQRTQVKTKGLVIRSVMLDQNAAAPFQEIIAVRFVKHRWWITVKVSLPFEEYSFRIFSFSADDLELMIAASCSAPILWSLPSSDEHQKHPPTSVS